MQKIKYILFEKAFKAKTAEAEIPEPSEKQVVIKTLRSLISPGTELAYFEGRHSDFATGRTSFPRSAPGYSAVGIIEKTGKEVTGFKEGDMVLSMSGHASKSVINMGNLTPVPAGLSPDYAACGILGSIALHGIREANIQFGANVLITGLGMIGQIALHLASLCPVRNIIAADTYPIRLAAANAGGSEHCINLAEKDLCNQVQDITEGKGCETVIECSGNVKAIATALKCCANRGKIVVLGCPHGIAELDLYSELQKKEITLIGSYQPNCPVTESGYTPWTQQKNRSLILEYLKKGRLDFSKIITHKMPHEKAEELYTLLSAHKEEAIGAVIDWENS